jgi:hypothetical protein
MGHKPGSPEWQEELNRQIAEHDRQQRERDAKIDAKLKEEAQEAAEEAARKEAEGK